MKHRGAAFYSRLVRNQHIRGITTYVLIAIDPARSTVLAAEDMRAPRLQVCVKARFL